MTDQTKKSRRLDGIDKANLEDWIARLDDFGAALGSWGIKTVQCRQKSMTVTFTFDNAVNPLNSGEIARIFESSPAMLIAVARRLLEVNKELESHD